MLVHIKQKLLVLLEMEMKSCCVCMLYENQIFVYDLYLMKILEAAPFCTLLYENLFVSCISYCSTHGLRPNPVKCLARFYENDHICERELASVL